MLTTVISQHRAAAAPNADNASFLIVLPTASGKDLLPCSVARAFSGTTICFHPFRHLTEAAADYCRTFHGTTRVYDAGLHSSCCYDVIVAAYEQATDSFVNFVQCLHRSGRLTCIIFNEAHVVLPHIDGCFRDFQLLCGLAPKLRHACGHPLVFVAMTATLQASHCADLAQTLCLPRWSCGLCVSPFRPNLQFRLIIQPTRQALIQATIDAALAATARIIVFVPSIFWCCLLSELLALSTKTVCQFHSDLDERQKFSSLSAFDHCPTAILVSTTALSCGMNVAGVNQVILFATVYSTENLLQSGGRAARYGGAGDVLFLTTGYFLNRMEHSDKFGSRQVAALARSPLGFATALEQLYLS